MRGKFKVQKRYSMTDWFCGNRVSFTCISRNGNKVCLAEQINVSGEFYHEPKEYDIHTDNDAEYVVIFEYHGHECRLYAKR